MMVISIAVIAAATESFITHTLILRESAKSFRRAIFDYAMQDDAMPTYFVFRFGILDNVYFLPSCWPQ